MHSNRTANFKEKEDPEQISINKEKIIKQYTTPLPKFDIHFKFSSEIEKENSTFSFNNDLLDKKAYEFIKEKDECLANLQLDDSLPNNNEENNIERKQE